MLEPDAFNVNVCAGCGRMAFERSPSIIVLEMTAEDFERTAQTVFMVPTFLDAAEYELLL
jgi:hypothetical protein